jgi:tetratricopeptide (TPR) repeat protein
MAKTNKPKPTNPQTNTPKPQVAAARPVQTIAKNWLERPTYNTENDGLLRNVFLGIAAFALIAMLWLSMGSGINADDKFQNDYCTKLVNYYSTMGKDTSALFVKDGNMHLYGGFFEVFTGFTNKALGYKESDLGYHNVRHASSAFLGWVAILCAGLLARAIAGWQAGIITLIVMFLSPRFLGDSLMNPKDIPFAAGYMMAIYNMVRVLQNMPSPHKRHLIGLVAGLGISLAMRAGGLLSFAYLFFFAGLHFLLNGRKDLVKYALITIGTAAAGYIFAILFWPYALQSPLKNPLNALAQFSALEVKIRVLFEGQNVMSDKTPWYYPVKWIAYTVPLAALLGLFGSLIFVPRLLKKYNPLFIAIVLFACIFPVFYVIYKKSVLHDGWRHLTFAYPAMAVAAGLFWNELTTFFTEKKALKFGMLGIMGAFLSDAGGFIAANPKMPYTYFNPIAGGTKAAFGNYETDYWGISTRQGIEYLEKEGILKPDMQEVVVIATNMYYPAKQLLSKYGDKVKLKYIKWDRRCDDAWDYALYPTRFIDGTTLQKGFWPPDNAVHIVEAGGAPILAVLKDNGKNCAFGTAAMKLGDWQTGIQKFKAEVQNVPDNDLAWTNLANAYLAGANLDSARICADKSLQINPDDSQANNIIGLIMMQKSDIAGAKRQFETAIKLEPSNAGAWYHLARIAQAAGDNNAAMSNIMKCINIAPNFTSAYELGAMISDAQGNTAQANQFRAALKTK